MIRDILGRLVAGNHLTRQESYQVMDEMLHGSFTPSQISGLLTSLRMKGETVEELIGFAQALQKHAQTITTDFPDLVDTCGTGGDGGKTFNISTATAFVCAAADVPVAKHGNRAVSSKSGSADVLEALGMNIELTTDMAHQLLQETKLSFLFAPRFHQQMKQVMPTRKELGFRTCFNLLGPLVNPANVKVQLVGVFDRNLTEPVAFALKELGLHRAMVVAGLDGLDEITVTHATQVSELNENQVFTYEITPTELGLSFHPMEAIAGGTIEENATLIRRIFQGDETGAPRDVVLLNAGAVLYIAGKVATIQEGVSFAANLIETGKVEEKLKQVVACSHEVKRCVS